MTHEMRRSDRAASTEAALDLLEKGEFGVLSTVGPEGEPYGCPLNYCLSEDRTCLFFHGAATGRKLENLRHDSRGHFTVVPSMEVVGDALTTVYSSVMVEGELFELTEKAEKIAAAIRLARRFGAPFDPTGYATAVDRAYVVFALRINAVSGKVRPALSRQEIEEFARSKQQMKG